MKRIALTAAALLTAFALPALAADPQPAPPESLDPGVARAAIVSVEADQAVIDAQAEAHRRAALRKIQTIRDQCGAPCAEAAPQAQAAPPEAAKP